MVHESKIEKHKAIIDYLKSEHGFTYGFANFVSLKARKSDAGSIDNMTLLTNQYKGKATTDRLENSGPFGAMCTHRVRLSAIDEVNSELVEWMQEAYEKAI